MLNQPARTGSTASKRDDSDSHQGGVNSFGVVYVNEVGRSTLVNEKSPQFAVGSIIVREKLAQADDAVPQLLAVMVKRERGFNPKANDWEFLILDGSASTIRHREKTGSCRDCHAQQKENDFVFRTYLPEDVRLKQQ